MRTASSGLDLIMEQRALNERPHDEAHLMSEQAPITAPERAAPGRIGQRLAMAVALGAICAAILYGVELSRHGPLVSATAARAPAASSTQG